MKPDFTSLVISPPPAITLSNLLSATFLAKKMNPQITPQQILEDRATRKASGMVGCMTGRPAPDLSYPRDFFGFRDVQIWNMDWNGRMNGDPNFNRRDPCCFCFDHRGAFDPTGEIDASLVNERHNRAAYAYRNLLPNEQVVNPYAVPAPPALVIPEAPNYDDDDDDDDGANDNDGIPPPGGDNEPQLVNPNHILDINLAPLRNAEPLAEVDNDANTEAIPEAVELIEPEDLTLGEMAYNDWYNPRDDDYDDRYDGYGGTDWNESGYFD